MLLQLFIAFWLCTGVSAFPISNDEDTLTQKDFDILIQEYSSEDFLINTFKEEDIETSKDDRRNLIIDFSNQFKWLTVLTKGKFDFLKHYKPFKRSLEGFDFDVLNFTTSEEKNQFSGYIDAVVYRPTCDSINEETFEGICQINPFKHKLVNCGSSKRPHAMRGLILPTIGLSVLGYMQTCYWQICVSASKYPKLQAVLFNPLFTTLSITRTSAKHLATALIINGFQDIFGTPFSGQIVGIQRILRHLWLDYRNYDCVNHEGKSVPIEKLTDDFGLKYIGGISKDPRNADDPTHMFEFALFPGNENNEIGYVEINRMARWDFDIIRENNFRFSYKHIGNLDVDLLNYYLSTRTVSDLFTTAFKSLTRENHIVLKKILANYRTINSLDQEDDDDHPHLSPITRFFFNHEIMIFEFNEAVRSVQHSEPMTLGFETLY